MTEGKPQSCSPSYEDSFSPTHPRLFCCEQIAGSHFLIGDVPEIAAALQRSVRTINGETFTVLNPEIMARRLDRLAVRLIPAEVQPEEVLLIFPGNGAQDVRRRTQLKTWFPNCIGVTARREWRPRESFPRTRVEKISPPPICRDVRHYMVMDDVICSGSTVHAIKDELLPDAHPDAAWYAASWVAQRPMNGAKSGVKGFTATAAATVVWRNNTQTGKPERAPLNSISTLANDRRIADEYAQRHVHPGDRNKFLSILRREGGSMGIAA